MLRDLDIDDATRRDEPFKFLAEACVLGNSGAGKTCMVQRVVRLPMLKSQTPGTLSEFTLNSTSTIGLDFLKVRHAFAPRGTDAVPNPPCRAELSLTLYDTAGQERFASMSRTYARNKDAVLLVFDASTPDSLRALPSWADAIGNGAGAGAPLRFVVGTKCDLVPGDPDATMADRAMQENRNVLQGVLPRCIPDALKTCDPMWVSAKSGEGVTKLFEMLAQQLFQRAWLARDANATGSISSRGRGGMPIRLEPHRDASAAAQSGSCGCGIGK
jgi:small GTP-binding protein